MKIFKKCAHNTPSCSHTWYRHEELANTITHFIGALLGIAALISLIVDASLYGSARGIVGVAIFGSSLVITYSASALYHLVREPRIKYHLRKLDHICIYLLIAGTYTPVTLVTLHGAWGWSLFGITWGLALLGICFKLLCFGKLEWVSTLAYVLMGWVVLVAISPIIQHLPMAGLIWLCLGGLFYTLGVFFFLMETVAFMHTVWHIFVLLGSLCHYCAILFYVAPIK